MLTFSAESSQTKVTKVTKVTLYVGGKGSNTCLECSVPPIKEALSTSVMQRHQSSGSLNPRETGEG